MKRELLVWLDFSQDTVDTLMRCGNAAETRNVLCDRLHIERGTDKSEILLGKKSPLYLEMNGFRCVPGLFGLFERKKIHF